MLALLRRAKQTRMAWYLALQGGPAHMAHQSSIYELQDSVDVEKIAQNWSVPQRWTEWLPFLRCWRRTLVGGRK